MPGEKGLAGVKGQKGEPGLDGAKGSPGIDGVCEHDERVPRCNCDTHVIVRHSQTSDVSWKLKFKEGSTCWL